MLNANLNDPHLGFASLIAFLRVFLVYLFSTEFPIALSSYILFQLNAGFDQDRPLYLHVASQQRQYRDLRLKTRANWQSEGRRAQG